MKKSKVSKLDHDHNANGVELNDEDGCRGVNTIDEKKEEKEKDGESETDDDDEEGKSTEGEEKEKLEESESDDSNEIKSDGEFDDESGQDQDEVENNSSGDDSKGSGEDDHNEEYHKLCAAIDAANILAHKDPKVLKDAYLKEKLLTRFSKKKSTGHIILK